ncbi:MAG: flavodoxin [Methanobacterium sp.]|nr:flavodoxin [Methanobacterium sp.]
MKILIACYSYSGNTLKVVEELKKLLNADLTEIKTVKDRWYLFKVWDSIRGNQVPIKSCINDLRNYDTLIVCCPIWAGRTPAAINEYLSLIKNAKDSNFAVLVTAGSDKKQKATIYIREYLSGQGMNFLGQILILAEDVKKDNFQDKLDIFMKRFQNDLEN